MGKMGDSRSEELHAMNLKQIEDLDRALLVKISCNKKKSSEFHSNSR